jgi:hypothetical protein
MKKLILITFLSLVVTEAAAQQIPDEETKTRALKRAYELNDNSMMGWGTIDLTDDPVVHPPKAEANAAPKPEPVVQPKKRRK